MVSSATARRRTAFLFFFIDVLTLVLVCLVVRIPMNICNLLIPGHAKRFAMPQEQQSHKRPAKVPSSQPWTLVSKLIVVNVLNRLFFAYIVGKISSLIAQLDRQAAVLLRDCTAK